MAEARSVHQRIRRGLLALAAVALATVIALRAFGIDPVLVRILAIASALLVVLLFITYRAMASGLAAAHAASRPDQTGDFSDKDKP